MIIMKKLTSLLIGCSLALAGAALAQQPDQQQSPSKNKQAPEKTHAAQAQPKPQARPQRTRELRIKERCSNMARRSNTALHMTPVL